jgi:hypothetical protein
LIPISNRAYDTYRQTVKVRKDKPDGQAEGPEEETDELNGLHGPEEDPKRPFRETLDEEESPRTPCPALAEASDPGQKEVCARG